MTIWNRLSVLQGFVPFSQRALARRRVRRWTDAAKSDSRLAIDLITLGGIMAAQPAALQDGWPSPALPDPQALAYQAGRRDLALQLLALMSLTPLELNALATEPDYGPSDDD